MAMDCDYARVDSADRFDRLAAPGGGGREDFVTADGGQHPTGEPVHQPLPPAERQRVFDSTYRRYHGPLFAWVFKKFGRFAYDQGSIDRARPHGLTRDDAEDIVSAAFAKLWDRLGSDPPRDPGPWLHAVVKDLAWTRIEREKNAAAARAKLRPASGAVRQRRSESNMHATGSSGIGGPADAGQPRQLTAAVRREDLLAAKAALESLADEDRRLVERVIIGGERGDAVAADLGLSAAAARKRLQRLRKALGDTLARTAGSTYLPAADADTLERERPRDRAAALRAIQGLPRDSARILELRYVNRMLPSRMAGELAMPVSAVQERLLHAESLFKKRYGMTVDQLRAVLESPEKGA